MRSFFQYLFLFLFLSPASAQTGAVALVKGQLVAPDNAALVNIEVVIPALKLMTTTDNDGRFLLSPVPPGKHRLVVGNDYANRDTFYILVDKDLVDLATLTADIDEVPASPFNEQMPTIALEDDPISIDDDGISDQHVPGILIASRDPFMSAAAFSFGPLRYRIRGYSRDQLEVYMNGLLMNDVETGSAFWGQWGGLNDVFRNQTVVFGLQVGDEGFGGLMGLTQINTTAASQRKQTRLTYSFANRGYRHRTMLTHSTGMLANGWALTASASRRWAKEAYIPGTFYDGYAYFLGISRRLNNKSMLHLSTFGAPTRRGKAAPTTQEAMDLAGSNYYNPNWGYLNGEQRNARVNHTFQPLFLLHYDYRPNSATLLQVAGGYQFGYNGNSAIDWYQAQDPRPDYYRNLPSYYLNDPRGADVDAAAAVRDEWLHPGKAQVNWERMYAANRLNYETINGISGLRSLYVIGEDKAAVRKYNVAINLQKALSEHLTIYSGLGFISQKTEYYREMLDLLGGDFYVNLNQFAERTYVGNQDLHQNDLHNPNGIVREGDKYAYDYIARFQKVYVWGQAAFTYNKFDFFLSGRLTMDAFSREGRYQVGLFPDDSYGKSATQTFLTHQSKAGVTYKFNGRNYLFIHAAYRTKAPAFNNTFYSPRTRNALVDQVSPEKITSVEGGYLLRAPAINGRLTGFVTEIRDATVIKRFYHEDYRSFVNYVMQGIAIRHLGAELAVQAKLSPSFGATAVATWMQVFYTSRPDVHIYRDNDTNSAASFSSAYLKNYYVAVGPQSAYTLGLNYRSPHYWYAYVNANFLDRLRLGTNIAALKCCRDQSCTLNKSNKTSYL